MIRKIKLAFVVDVENWAFSNIARQFEKYLTNKFEISIIYMSKINGNAATMWLLLHDQNIVHFFCRGLAISYLEEYIKPQILELGGDIETFQINFIKGKLITTCVYDHLFLDNDINFTLKLFNIVKNYYVSSNKLKVIYDNLNIAYKPNCVITDGIDFNEFYPINLNRFSNINNHKLKIGWVGNSKWVDNSNDYKGLNSIIKPAIEDLKNEGYNIELYTSDKIDKIIPIKEMVNYYSNIDLYVCASIAEGTPNPILESMACGVPIISTDVGIVRELFGPKQSEMIILNRTVEDLKEKIKFMLNNKSVFSELSTENLKYISQWNWKSKALDFNNFITTAYKDFSN